MKNLSELSDEQKSVMLARLCGWHIGNLPTNSGDAWIRVLCDKNGNDLGLRPPFGGGLKKKHVELLPSKSFNIYDTANMALAWRVLNWAEDKASEDTRSDFHLGWMEFLPESLFECSPEDAQRAWLDEILKLANETGMLEEQNAND